MTDALLIDYPPSCFVCDHTYTDGADAATHCCTPPRILHRHFSEQLLPDDAPRPVHVPSEEDLT